MKQSQLTPRPATFNPTSVYLGPVYKSGKNEVTKHLSIKISYTSNYLFCKLDSYTK